MLKNSFGAVKMLGKRNIMVFSFASFPHFESRTLVTLCCELSMAERKHGYFPRTIIETSLGIPKGFL